MAIGVDAGARQLAGHRRAAAGVTGISTGVRAGVRRVEAERASADPTGSATECRGRRRRSRGTRCSVHPAARRRRRSRRAPGRRSPTSSRDAPRPAVQIDRHVVAIGPQAPRQPEVGGETARGSPARARDDDLVEVGIAQRRPARRAVRRGRRVGVREPPPKRPECRRREDDVADQRRRTRRTFTSRWP